MSKTKFLATLFLTLVMMAVRGSGLCMAQTSPDFGTHISLTYSEGSFNIANTNFNSSAKSIKVFFDFGDTPINWGSVAYNKWNAMDPDKRLLTLSASKRCYTIIVDQSDVISEIAQNSGISVNYGDAREVSIIVTNYETADGAANDNSAASGIEPEDDNPGGGSSGSTFTGDKEGGYTYAELEAQYGGIDEEKLSLVIANKRQITHLPTVYITVADIVDATSQADINAVLYKEGNTAEYHKATIKVVDDGHETLEFEDDKLDIKVRGNETAKGTKKPYRLKFGKDKKDAEGNVIETHKHDMLGLGYQKRNWTLIANQKDGSMAHNALSYHIGKAVGMDFCPGYRFVDLVINDVYLGCYMVSDHVEVGSNRIELEDESTGWYIETNRQDQVEEPYVSAGGLNVSIKSPEPADEAETAALKAEVSDFFTQAKAIMDKSSDPAVFCDPETGWRAYFDEEALVKYYVGTNLAGNHDGFMTVKMSRDMGKKMKVGPLWDHDTAFGIYDDGATLSEDAQSGAPLFCNYAKAIADNDPVFMKKVHDLTRKVMDAGYMTNILKNVDDITSSVYDSQRLEAPWADAYKTEPQKLKTYIETHSDWLVQAIDAKYEALGGSLIVENTTIYRTDGTLSFVSANSFTAAQLSANEVATLSASANISGQNVVSLDSEGDVCSSFVLTDGVDFAYSGEKFTATTAVYERNVTSDWGMLCLPYKVTVAEDDDFEYFVLDHADGATMTLKAAGKTGAWKQLIYHRKNAQASKLVVSGEAVTVKPVADVADTNPLEGWTAIGVASATTVQPSAAVHNYYLSDGNLVLATEAFELPAFQAYFTLDKSLVADAPATFKLSDGNEEITLEGITDADGNAVVLTPTGNGYTTGSVVLTDGVDFTSPVAFTAASITYQRTLAAGKWGTLCLPYALSARDGYEYYALSAVSSEAVTLSQIEDEVPAGTPVLVRHIDAADLSLTETNVQVGISTTTAAAIGGLQLVGTLVAKPVTSGYYLDATDEQLHSIEAYCSESGASALTIPAYRAWISGSVSAGAPLRVNVEGEATSLSALRALTEGTAQIYDLYGNRRSDLQPGVNVVNGVKIIIEN